jgi:SAM-dependent methyltransferase
MRPDDGVRSYSFGTGTPASVRLVHLADVFAPTMAAVLDQLPLRRWHHVVDLGCGPGSSTAHLRRLLDGDAFTGIDASTDFVASARERVPGVAFVVGDVLEPLPVSSPDLIYSRFVLSHLGGPLAVAARWTAALGPGGYLVLEEPERIETGEPAFTDYLDLTTAVVASRGATMLVGATLAGLVGAGTVVNRPFPHPVSRTDAAQLFQRNLASIRSDPFVRATRTAAELDRLDEQLRIAGERDGRTVDWTIRQVIVARPGPR